MVGYYKQKYQHFINNNKKDISILKFQIIESYGSKQNIFFKSENRYQFVTNIYILDNTVINTACNKGKKNIFFIMVNQMEFNLNACTKDTGIYIYSRMLYILIQQQLILDLLSLNFIVKMNSEDNQLDFMLTHLISTFAKSACL